MRKLIVRILVRLIPRALRDQLTNFKILAVDFGQWRSIKQQRAVDREGSPIPWYTYPATEYLKRFDFSDKRIFEWGCGNSSLFWAQRSKEIISVEDNKKWFDIVDKNKFADQKIILLEKKEDYIRAIADQKERFDVVIIDAEHRYECAKRLVASCQGVGLVILDNSDWFPKTVKLLRGHGLIQIDFSGFGPASTLTWTTSLFFERNFFETFSSDKELKPIGAVRRHADE